MGSSLIARLWVRLRLNHARIQDFFGGGGGGGSRRYGQKQSGQCFLFCLVWSSTYFTVSRWGPMVLLHRKQFFSKDPREGPTFSRGGPTFLRGVQTLISLETHITCDFPVGGPDPLSPSGSAHINDCSGVKL